MRKGFRRFQFELTPALEQALSESGYGLQKPQALAEAIRKLSDHYAKPHPRISPWTERWAQAAYLSYFLPLNSARLQAVFAQGQALGFFNNLTSVWDFGAGPGTAFLAWQSQKLPSLNWHAIESEPAARKLGSALTRQTWHPQTPHSKAPDLGIFSYVLNELPSLPEWAYECEALVLVEPSTQQLGRKLQALRTPLIERGFSLWAPCTHQHACPLLVQSERDWCHDRIEFERPRWFTRLEEHLPMKNATLTFSYLLARKSPPPTQLSDLGRFVGDQLVEKGKTRQLFCRGPEREFVAWMHRNGEPPEFSRGTLVALSGAHEKKAQELRVTTSSIEAFDFQVSNSPHP